MSQIDLSSSKIIEKDKFLQPLYYPVSIMMSNSKEFDNSKNDPRINAGINNLLSNEPLSGNSLENIDYNKREPILATPRREIKDKEIRYRILFPDNVSELVMIIPPKISIDLARKGLADLKTLSINLHKDFPEELTLSAKIYLEYQQLSEKYSWSIEEISQQVSYDFLITSLMLKNEKSDSLIFHYADIFQDALIEFIRTPRTKKQEFKEKLNDAVKYDELSFNPLYGYKFYKNKTQRNLADSLQAWNLDFKTVNSHNEFRGVLASFWVISFLLNYWQELDECEDMRNYNRKRRNELIAKYMEGITTNFGEFFKSGPIDNNLLQKFVDGINIVT